jgi:hypothetical protein
MAMSNRHASNVDLSTTKELATVTKDGLISTMEAKWIISNLAKFFRLAICAVCLCATMIISLLLGHWLARGPERFVFT